MMTGHIQQLVIWDTVDFMLLSSSLHFITLVYTWMYHNNFKELTRNSFHKNQKVCYYGLAVIGEGNTFFLYCKFLYSEVHINGGGTYFKHSRCGGNRLSFHNFGNFISYGASSSHFIIPTTHTSVSCILLVFASS